MTSLDEQFDLWAVWFLEIADEIDFLHRSAATFWQLQDYVRENTAKLPPVPWHWFNSWVASNWMVATSARLRALGDRNPDTRSFRALLSKIRDNPHVFTRARYLALTHATEPVIIERSNKEFDNIAGAGGQIDPTLVVEDVGALDGALSVIKDYVDKRIAHLDREWTARRMSGKPLNDALAVLRRLAEEYYPLFTGSYAPRHFGQLLSFDIRQVLDQERRPDSAT